MEPIAGLERISKGRWKLVSFVSSLSGRNPTTEIYSVVKYVALRIKAHVFNARSLLALSRFIRPVLAKKSY